MERRPLRTEEDARDAQEGRRSLDSGLPCEDAGGGFCFSPNRERIMEMEEAEDDPSDEEKEGEAEEEERRISVSR